MFFQELMDLFEGPIANGVALLKNFVAGFFEPNKATVIDLMGKLILCLIANNLIVLCLHQKDS